MSEKAARGLNNVLFFNEIDSSEIPGLLAQCHVGLVALHPDHKTHNIPGKFVSYVQYGLPVLARVNAGTDLARLIEERGVGKVYVGNSVDELKRLAEELIDQDSERHACRRGAGNWVGSCFRLPRPPGKSWQSTCHRPTGPE